MICHVWLDTFVQEEYSAESKQPFYGSKLIPVNHYALHFGPLRTLRETIEKGDKKAAEQTYRQTVSALDKAVQKGTLHGNTASRYKSRLGVRVNAMK